MKTRSIKGKSSEEINAALLDSMTDLSRKLELKHLLTSVIERAVSLLEVTGGELAIYDEDAAELEVVASFNLGMDSSGVRLKHGEGAMGIVARTREPLIIPDYQTWEGRSGKYTETIVRSVMVVPLLIGDKLVGTLAGVHLETHRHFSHEDLALLQMFAPLAATAIENARLFEEERRRADEQRALLATMTDLSRKLELNHLLASVLERAVALLEVTGGELAIYHDDLKELEVVASHNLGMDSLGVRLKHGEGVMGKVAESMKALIIPDYQVWEGRSEKYTETIVRSVIVVPLLIGDQLVGALGAVHLEEDRRFNKKDLQLLNMFAPLAATAIENARLFNKTRNLLQAAETESALEKVRSVAMGMRAAAEMTDVCKMICCQLEQLGVKDIRNVQTVVVGPGKQDYMNYEYYRLHDECVITRVPVDHPHQQRFIDKILESPDAFYSLHLSNAELKEWFQYQKSTPQFVDSHLEGAETLNYYFYSIGEGAFGVSTYVALTELHLDMIRQFRNVFLLAYRRYVDIEKAAAQAKEAQIEAALERVRARAMAMQDSGDLSSTASTVFTELKRLGINPIRCGVGLLTKDSRKSLLYSATTSGDNHELALIGWAELVGHPVLENIYTHWLNDEDYFPELSGTELASYYKQLLSGFAIPSVPDGRTGDKQFGHFVPFSDGCLYAWSANPYNEIEIQILKRFAAVIDLTFKRYLDLKKAEAQAREARVEAALEKVRSATMAMHHSDELLKVITCVTEQLKSLNFNIDTANFDIEKKKGDWDLWMYSAVSSTPNKIHIPCFDHPLFNKVAKAMDEGKELTCDKLTREEKDSFLQHLFSNTALKHAPEERKQDLFNREGFDWSTASMKNTTLTIVNYDGLPYTDEENEILLRFGKVFEQSFTRFLDLQKAEAQVREAQIEASLERVRTKTMAMHNSHDVGDTAIAMFKELETLGVTTNRCGIVVYTEDRHMEVWTAASGVTDAVEIIGIGTLDTRIHPLLAGGYEAWKNKKSNFLYQLIGEDLEEYYRALEKAPGYPYAPPETLPEKQSTSLFFFPEGGIFAFTNEPLTEEAKQIFNRYAGLFALTYRRFLDLQKAEAQARNAEIEASLERVRARAMAMHDSGDVAAATAVLFTELEKLEISALRCGIYIIDPSNVSMEVWRAADQGDGKVMQDTGSIPMTIHPMLQQTFDEWKNGASIFSYWLEGADLHNYYRALTLHAPVFSTRAIPTEPHVCSSFFFSEGGLFIFASRRFSEEQEAVLQKFAAVFGLTYRRYLDLKISEEQARQARKQASIDRVRAEIASMRTTSDLERITPLVWDELKLLTVPFTRCGVFIMEEGDQLVHTFLSTPDGKAIAAFHIPYGAEGPFSKILTHWQKKEKYLEHWSEGVFREFGEVLVKEKVLASSDEYLSTVPANGVYLHCIPFQQGMFYVGNEERLPDDQVELVESLADAFSTAYARYQDFNRLEAAKQQVDKTLDELKQAQQQLVQSEKMASLGELTAGIAHEIQNPLNFVNNFSEVNIELLDEMLQEIKQGNNTDAIEIADGIRQNLEKVSSHGKRADAIVKSMLQHSRKTSGQKEEADLNALVDEYLRLSYHGLRAKDKSFNIIIETHFDPAVGKVKIVGQDIGRVMLNLFNNAFYSVNERKKQLDGVYEPLIQVATVRTSDGIEIKVKDNGTGIPGHVVDKIYQPFFTTKATGEGTGLGLSLSYDIITKGHGGALHVTTEENEGAEFTIVLP